MLGKRGFLVCTSLSFGSAREGSFRGLTGPSLYRNGRGWFVDRREGGLRADALREVGGVEDVDWLGRV